MYKTSCLAAVFSLLVATPALGAGTFHVDNTNPACSDTGPGTLSNPYCSISAAVDKQRGPGTTILVHPGFYPEQVTVPSSGDSVARLTIRALSPEVVVDGADDFSNPNLWEHFHKKVWQVTGVSSDPHQVFLDGVRLVRSAGPRKKVKPGEFFYVNGQGLYVNIGGADSNGDNPGTRDLRIGLRPYGFRLSGRSWVTIDGFTVQHAETKGIYVLGNVRGVAIENNTVRRSGGSGIAVVSASDVRIASNIVSDNLDHGIAFVDGVTGSAIEDNESFNNARPDVRAANGIYLFGSTGNRVQRNRIHHNQDTGLEITRDAHQNISLQNLSWSNGDHGFDCIRAQGTVQIGNVAWNNLNDGFSVEGGANQTIIMNCIAANNGVSTDHFNLFVDSSSILGFSSDFNVFWNSTAQEPLSLAGSRYESIEDFAQLSGWDTHSIQADPMFIDPAAGDFRLRSGSPGIDSGNSSLPFWPETDADGLSRFDDPTTPNSGEGPVAYADRGAHEYFTMALAVGDQPPSGSSISLSVAYPNPSGSAVRFDLELPRSGRVAWSVHDLQGRQIWGAAAEREAGRSVLRWSGERSDGRPAEPGYYFVRVAAGGAIASRPVILIR